MSRSAALRACPKRNNDSQLTNFQDYKLLGNIQIMNDSTQPLFVYKNDYWNCRGFQDIGNNLLEFDSEGWPSNHNWLFVLTDGNFFRGLAPQPTNTDSNPEGQKVVRWKAGDSIKCRCNSSSPFLPIRAYAFCEITKAYKEDDFWYFTINITGGTPILAGSAGSMGVRDLVIPAKGYTIESCLTGTLLSDEMLDFYKQFYGLRFMEYQITNGGSIDNNALHRGCWGLRSVIGTNSQAIRSIKKYTTNNGYKTTTFGANIEHIVQIANEIKNRQGSNLQKIWINIPHEVCGLKTVSELYNFDEDEFTGIWSANTSSILYQSEDVNMSIGEEYIRNTADYVAKNLHPSIVTYWELSNEVWNTMFAQSTWFTNKQTDLKGNDENGIPYNLNYNVDESNIYYMRQNVYSYYAIWASRLVKEVFTDNNIPTRQRFMLGSWINNPELAIKLPIEYIEHWTQEPISNTFYGLATAAYVGPEGYQNFSENELATKVEEHAEEYLTRGRSYTILNSGLKWAKEYCVAKNIKHIAYELGLDYQVIPDPNAWNMVKVLENFELSKDLYFSFISNFLNEAYDELWYYSITPQTWWADYSNQFTIFPIGPRKMVGPSVGFNNAGNSPKQIHANNTFPTETGNTVSFNAYTLAYTNEKITQMWTSTQSPGNIYGGMFPNDSTDISNSWKENPKIHYAVYVESEGDYEISLTGWGGFSLKKQKEDLSSTETLLTSTNIPVTEINPGKIYRIDFLGDTDWISCGAASNAVGISFIATQSGSGTGTVSDPISIIPNELASGNANWNIKKRKWENLETSNNPLTELSGNCRIQGYNNGSLSTPALLKTSSIIDHFEEGWHHLLIALDVPGILYGDVSGELTGIATSTPSTEGGIIRQTYTFNAKIYQDNPETTTSNTSIHTNFTSNNPPLTNLVVDTGLTYQKYDGVIIENSDKTCWLTGYVESYDNQTGQMELICPHFGAGSVDGMYDSWTIKRCYVSAHSVGEGYTTNTQNIIVNISPPDIEGGTQATASVKTVNQQGQILDVIVTNCGSGYSYPPLITFTDTENTPTKEAKGCGILKKQIYSVEPKVHNMSYTDTLGGKTYTYLVDALGDKIYDANNDPIILATKNVGASWGLRNINVTKIS